MEQENNSNEINTPLFLNEKTWKYEVSQDSNQFDNAYLKIRKEKRKPKNKVFDVIHIKTDKLNTLKNRDSKPLNFEPSPTITESDFNEDLDEFSEINLEKKTIGSINMKFNDINLIDIKNKVTGQYSYKKHLCITEPDNFIDTSTNTNIYGMHNRNLSTSITQGGNKFFNNNINHNFSNLTPNTNKVIPFGTYNLTPRNFNFQPQNNYGIINNNIIYNNNLNQINHHTNFGKIMTTNPGSFISQSNYSSNNKVRDVGYEHNEESTEVGDYSHEE